MIKLRLPIPPSANRYWRHDRGITHLAREAHDYRNLVGQICNIERVVPFGGDVKLAVTFDFYGLHARRDMANCEKQLSDALQMYCFEDDNQIIDLHLRRHVVPKLKVKDGYVEVEIKEAME